MILFIVPRNNNLLLFALIDNAFYMVSYFWCRGKNGQSRAESRKKNNIRLIIINNWNIDSVHLSGSVARIFDLLIQFLIWVLSLFLSFAHFICNLMQFEFQKMNWTDISMAGYAWLYWIFFKDNQSLFRILNNNRYSEIRRRRRRQRLRRRRMEQK